MDNSGYTTLTRQSGLIQEMQAIAHNIANASTTGFRQEGIIFSEFVVGTDNGPSVSMARGEVRNTSYLQGKLLPTGSQMDFAIEGDGFFQIATPDGERLTRAGNFTLSQTGDLVTLDGFNVLDAGGAPVFIPPDAVKVDVSSDGSISAAQGRVPQRPCASPKPRTVPGTPTWPCQNRVRFSRNMAAVAAALPSIASSIARPSDA